MVSSGGRGAGVRSGDRSGGRGDARGLGGVTPVFLHSLVLSSLMAARNSKESCVRSGDRSGAV